MPSPERPNTRYASAKAPVNLRTAAKGTPPAPRNPLTLHAQRFNKARRQARHLLGPTLQDQLITGKGRTLAQRTPAAAIMLGLSGAGMLTAWLLSSVAMGAGAVTVGLGGAVLLTWQRRQVSAGALQPAPAMGSVFDAQAVALLDEVLLQAAPELPAHAMGQLVALKQSLVRVAPLLARTTVNELFTQDDRFYIMELVRRYLPDTLQAYLQVPAAQRTTRFADNPSALDLLGEQLHQLQSGLLQREAALTQAATENLKQQGRFLQSKHVSR